MGNIGIGELALIVLIILLVFGPNRLPEIMRNLGKAYRTFQEETHKATSVLRDGIEGTGEPPGPGVIDAPDAAGENPPLVKPTDETTARAHEDT